MQTRVLDDANYIKDYLRAWENSDLQDGVNAVAVFDKQGNRVHGIGTGYESLTAGALKSGSVIQEDQDFTVITRGILNSITDADSEVIGTVSLRFSKKALNNRLEATVCPALLFVGMLILVSTILAYFTSASINRRFTAS